MITAPKPETTVRGLDALARKLGKRLAETPADDLARAFLRTQQLREREEAAGLYDADGKPVGDGQ